MAETRLLVHARQRLVRLPCLVRPLVVCLVLVLLAFPPLLLAQQDERCFPETGYCISGRIREYWEQNGGLPVFGFPITPQREEMIEGQPYQAQWFERNRLELHPENDPPYDVLLGRLGAPHVSEGWTPAQPEEGGPGCVLFETGWNVCDDILATFRSSGLELDGQPGHSLQESIALFGLPLSPVIPMEIEGTVYDVQWFERARFELHPENQPPYHVLSGLLGREAFDAQSGGEQPAPQPTPAPAPTSAPAPPAPEGVPMPTIPTGGPLKIDNVTLTNPGTGTRDIVLSIGWPNSWRESGGRANWDAAWLFVKYRVGGGAWQHAALSSSASDYSAASGPPAAFTPAQDGTGVFLARAVDGSGPVQWDGVRLRWNAQQNNVQPGDNNVEVRVFALEMVVIPTGSFFVGDGASIGRFHTGGDPATPYQVTESRPTLSNDPGGLWADEETIPLPAGAPGPSPWLTPARQLADTYPTGYQAFYMMKHELTQGMYAAFLNMLTPQQAQARYPSRADFPRIYTYPTAFRYTITESGGSYTASAPNRANNWMNWDDVAAISDWAGLRPMSELEYEKACRGSGQTPVAGEFAWGTTTIQHLTGIAGPDDSGSDTPVPPEANASYWPAPHTDAGPPMRGPVRVGFFQQPGDTREQAGASYYGVLELTGNIIEPVVTIGNNLGRSYTGLHGDGTLAPSGDADVAGWPRIPDTATGVAGPFGFGFRGGDFYVPIERLPVSSRTDATVGSPKRLFGLGHRAVRTAP